MENVKRAVFGLILCASVALPSLALGTTTWTDTGTRSVKAVCTTGTESAPTTSAHGALISDVGGFVVVIEAAAGQTVSGGTLLAYAYNDISGVWARVPELDLAVPATALRSYAFSGFTVTAGRGRFAYVPSGVTISSGSATIYLNAVSDTGGRL